MVHLPRNFRACAAALVLATCATPVSAVTEQVQGHVVLARAGKNALVIWDATPDVIAIVQNKLSDQAANEKLERDALKALATKISVLNKATDAVAARVVYQKIGAVSPIYGSATFAGIEVYATVMMSGKDAIGNRDKWAALPADGPIPSWVEFKVAGKLPPR